MLGAAKYIITCLSFLSCAPAYKNPELQQLVDDFDATYGVSSHEVYVNFSTTLTKTELGRCTREPLRKEVFISKGPWLLLTTDQKRVLIYHELAHCTLGLGHDNSMLQDNCPKSIMNSHMITQPCIKRHWEHLEAELFPKININKHK